VKRREKGGKKEEREAPLLTHLFALRIALGGKRKFKRGRVRRKGGKRREVSSSVEEALRRENRGRDAVRKREKKREGEETAVICDPGQKTMETPIGRRRRKKKSERFPSDSCYRLVFCAGKAREGGTRFCREGGEGREK